jgi:hypothetical protein
MKVFIAILRSLVLLVVLYFVLLSTPWGVFGSDNTMVAVRDIRKLVQGAWIATGWIALEVVVSWFTALRKRKSKTAGSAKSAPADPPQVAAFSTNPPK